MTFERVSLGSDMYIHPDSPTGAPTTRAQGSSIGQGASRLGDDTLLDHPLVVRRRVDDSCAMIRRSQ
eukprot:2449823-Prorocentrum_lima.AAC.1